MKKILTATACLAVFGLLVSVPAAAQQAQTGDRTFDASLRAIEQEAQGDPEGYVRHLSQKFGVPEAEINQAREQHRLTYGDTYMATALARRTNRNVGEVAAQYKQNQGQGWGTMALAMGIKPGSQAFKQMKADAKGVAKQAKAMTKARNRMRVNEQNLDKDKKRTQSEGAKKSTKQTKSAPKKKK
jgi:hypothetical protein